MSQLHTYKSYIEYLVDQSKTKQLDDLAIGILQTYFMVNELQTKNESLRKALRTVRFEDDHSTRVDYCNKVLE